MANKEQYSSLMTIKELTMCFVDKEINQENIVPLSIVHCLVPHERCFVFFASFNFKEYTATEINREAAYLATK